MNVLGWGEQVHPSAPSEDPTSSPVADLGKEVGGSSFLVHLPPLLHFLGLWASSTVLGPSLIKQGHSAGCSVLAWKDRQRQLSLPRAQTLNLLAKCMLPRRLLVGPLLSQISCLLTDTLSSRSLARGGSRDTQALSCGSRSSGPFVFHITYFFPPVIP